MWHHSPAHILTEAGAYIVTAGTYRKQPFFNTDERRDLVLAQLFDSAGHYQWRLQAWAVMSNHYHFVAIPAGSGQALGDPVKHLHSRTALAVNRLDRTSGRKVWFQYWDTHLTFEKSYLARLNYVHNNPVHHKLVSVATAYPWCSAAWFEQKASEAFVRTVRSFKHDNVNVPDDF